MVRDHDGSCRVTFGQGSLQPGPALAVPLLDVIGRDQSLRWKAEFVAVGQILLFVINPDRVVVGQVPVAFELDQILKPGAEELEVCPERAAQKTDAAQGEFVVLQEMDAQVFGLAAHARKSTAPMGVVELVVASHIDDLRFREHLSGAGQAPALFDVASEDDHVGLLHCCGWRREGMIFQVHVAVNEEAHSYK